MFRDALCDVIDGEPDMEVVGRTGDGGAVLALVRTSQPDVVVMDIGLPGINGITATRQILATAPGIRIVAVSTHTERHFITEMLEAGACGYVTKSAAADELLRALRAIATGRTYLCGDCATALLSRSADELEVAALGRRERQVLQLLAEGKSSPDIAAELFIAPGTVDVHRRNIMQKLNLHTVAELTKWAVRHGLTQP